MGRYYTSAPPTIGTTGSYFLNEYIFLVVIIY
jgi:hypothetical protein